MKGQIPTGISVVFAVITFMLFRSGHAEIAWVLIVVGGLMLGLLMAQNEVVGKCLPGVKE